MQIKPRSKSKTKRYSFLKIFEEEDVVVEDVTVVEVVEAATSREDSRVSKIGVAEDVVKEVVGRTIPTLNATSVASMVIMRRTVTHSNATTVIKWDILQKIVELKRR